jgi:hypothetical protein
VSTQYSPTVVQASEETHTFAPGRVLTRHDTSQLVARATGLAPRWLVSARLVLAALGPFLSALVARTGWYSARPVARATGLAPRWLVSARLVLAALGPRWFSSSRATSLSPRWSARVGPLVSTGSARAALCALAARSPLCALVARFSPLVARPKVSCRAGPVAGSPCPDGLPPLFFSAAQSPARANSAGIRSLSSVPHLWSSSFDCPASQVKRRPKCDRIAPSHPLSWPCVSDLLLLKGES